MTATTLPVFLIITVVLSGGAGFLTGQVLAANWRPVWMALFYCLLLGLVDRGLVFALIDRDLFSVSGYVIDTAVVIAFCFIGYRLTHVRKMVTQYPWLYARTSPWSYRRRNPATQE